MLSIYDEEQRKDSNMPRLRDKPKGTMKRAQNLRNEFIRFRRSDEVQ